jgi:hypothetical protein
MQIIMNARHAAAQTGQVDSRDLRKARQVMGDYEGNLRPSKDYSGNGTKVSPIEFRQHLLYYQAIPRFLEQMGESSAERQLEYDGHGRLCDCYRGQKREWWFVIPVSSLEMLLGKPHTQNSNRS